VAGYATPGSSYDRLNLGNNVLTLGGTSSLTLDLAGLTTTGTALGVILYGSNTGTFTTVNPPINNPNNFLPVLTYNGTSLDINFTVAATRFVISAPSSATAGGAFSITVTAQDAAGNTATGYTGTVHFTKSDGGGGSSVPNDYTFVAGDNGSHTFTN